MTNGPGHSPSSRSFKTLIPCTPTNSKRTRPELSILPDPPVISPNHPRKNVLLRGKTVLKKAVSSGGAALGVRKSSSHNEGLRAKLLNPSSVLQSPNILPPTQNFQSSNPQRHSDTTNLYSSPPAQPSIYKPCIQIKSPQSEPKPPNVQMELHNFSSASSLQQPATNKSDSLQAIAQITLLPSTKPEIHQNTQLASHPNAKPSGPSQIPLRHSFRKNSVPSGTAEPDDGGQSYESRFTRISHTGIVERSVAAAVISAARHRGLPRKNKYTPMNPAPQHHRPHGGFCNPWDSALKETGLRGRSGPGSRTFFHKVAKDRRPPDEQLATMLLLARRPDFVRGEDAVKQDKYALASHWIGHCTFLLQAKGLTVLTDPVWSPRLGPLGSKRLVPPPCEIAELPQSIDVVLLSNSCYDNFDKNAVQSLSSRVDKWLVPIGLRALLVASGVEEDAVVELDWWQEYQYRDSLFVCTPAQHYSLRDDTLWCSWVVHAPHHRFFFCGGTGYRSVYHDGEDSDSYGYRQKYGGPSCPVFKEISRRYGSCDTALLPIGGFKPRTVMSGVQGDAIDMLFVHKDLRARRSLAHRWGTYASGEEGMLDAIRALEHGLQTGPVAEHEFSYLKHGRLHIT